MPYGQDAEQLIQRIQSFIRAHPRCEAMLFATNYLGAYGLKALVGLGRRIPEHMAFVSFDDSDLFRLYSPPITVVAQPMELMAENVIHTLLAALEGTSVPGRVSQTQLAAQLLVRQSSIRPAGASRPPKSGF